MKPTGYVSGHSGIQGITVIAELEKSTKGEEKIDTKWIAKITMERKILLILHSKLVV